MSPVILVVCLDCISQKLVTVMYFLSYVRIIVGNVICPWLNNFVWCEGVVYSIQLNLYSLSYVVWVSRIEYCL